jgi:UDP-N-acetylglucosamine:LPS N-acetylglucosamine transferase
MVFMKILGGQHNTLKISYNVKFSKYKKAVAEVYSSYEPDLILTTYYGDLHALLCAKEKKQINSIITAYNPDHNTHGWWDKRVEMFFCNNKLAYEEAISKSKMKEENVFQVNFMSRSSLQEITESKEFYREKHNIPKDKFCVILADGAYGMASMEKFTDELLKTDLPITLIPVCGKNEELFAKYEKLQSNVKPNVTLIPQRFIPYIAELYKASDLFVTKSGPNAITDCIYMHKPILTNFFTGPIERASNKLFTEKGHYETGIYCPDAKKARLLIEEFIQNPSKLETFKENTKQFDVFKNGAKDVADLIAKRLGIKTKD